MENRKFSNQELLEHALFYSKKEQEIQLKLERLLETLNQEDTEESDFIDLEGEEL